MPDFTELWPGGPLFAQAENRRLSTDSVLLADFVPLRHARRGIDLGCASGAVALLLLARERALDMTGLELDEGAAALARANLERHGLTDRARIVPGDIRARRQPALFPRRERRALPGPRAGRRPQRDGLHARGALPGRRLAAAQRRELLPRLPAGASGRAARRDVRPRARAQTPAPGLQQL